MPLIYAREGISSPYMKVTAIEPTTPTFDAILQGTKVTPTLHPEQSKSSQEMLFRHSHLKGYDTLNSNPPERKQVLCARDIMTKSIHTLKTSATLNEAREILQNERIKHIPILHSNQELAGILSDRDILRAGPDLQALVTTQMTSHVLAATPETTIQEIADAMLSHKVHAMPIVNSKIRSELWVELGTDLRIVGILTTTDILRAIVKRAPIELWV